MKVRITGYHHRSYTPITSASMEPTELAEAVGNALIEDLRRSSGAFEGHEQVIRAQAKYLGLLTQALLDAKVLTLSQVVDFLDRACLSFTQKFTEVDETEL